MLYKIYSAEEKKVLTITEANMPKFRTEKFSLLFAAAFFS